MTRCAPLSITRTETKTTCRKLMVQQQRAAVASPSESNDGIRYKACLQATIVHCLAMSGRIPIKGMMDKHDEGEGEACLQKRSCKQLLFAK